MARRLTADQKVRGSSPTAALMSFDTARPILAPHIPNCEVHGYPVGWFFFKFSPNSAYNIFNCYLFPSDNLFCYNYSVLFPIFHFQSDFWSFQPPFHKFAKLEKGQCFLLVNIFHISSFCCLSILRLSNDIQASFLFNPHYWAKKACPPQSWSEGLGFLTY